MYALVDSKKDCINECSPERKNGTELNNINNSHEETTIMASWFLAREVVCLFFISLNIKYPMIKQGILGIIKQWRYLISCG